MNPGGKPPAPRQYTAAVYNPGSNRLTVFGGDGSNTALSDVWVLKNANGLHGNPAWKQIKPSYNYWQPGTEGRWNCQGVDLVNDRMILTLGNGNPDGPSWSTWVLSHADDE